MPRYSISVTQPYFDLLMGILDRNDNASKESWHLIQMLCTNPTIYKRVLQLEGVAADGSNWAQFFDTSSVYRLLYTLQIVEAVMEEGEGEGLENVKVKAD